MISQRLRGDCCLLLEIHHCYNCSLCSLSCLIFYKVCFICVTCFEIQPRSTEWNLKFLLLTPILQNINLILKKHFYNCYRNVPSLSSLPAAINISLLNALGTHSFGKLNTRFETRISHLLFNFPTVFFFNSSNLTLIPFWVGHRWGKNY